MKPSIEKVTISTVNKAQKRLNYYIIPVYISILGIIFSVPVWIWFGWSIAWRVFLTSLFLFLVFKGINNISKKVFKIWKEDLLKQDKIDYNK
jgi:hypothetical protein